MSETTNNSLENEFKEIENIISKMEDTDITLEDSFKYYEMGIKKIRNCNEIIDQVEKKMQVLNESGELEEF